MKKLIVMTLVLVCYCGPALLGQETTGQINGTVLDSQGAAIAKAKVIVTSTGTGFTRTAVSESSGSYNVPLLPPGTYNLRVEAPGFSAVEQKGISLLVGQALTIDQTLKPGGANEVVEVNGQAPLIDETSSQIGGSVSPTEVTELPLLNRNFSELMSLIPGVRPAEGFDPTKTRVGNVSINGGDGRQTDTNVDGADDKDLVVGGMVQNFTVEGIQEFNVITDRYTAEAGHSVGGIVNVITKSGTNQLHGSAFGLGQLSTLNRTNFFEAQNCQQQGISDVSRCKAVYHRWQYGGSVGGPVIKDKVFFFGAFEQKREPGGLTVNPTSFSALTTLASQTSGFAGGPYAFPVTGLPFPYIDDLATVKLDYKISDKHYIFARYGRQKWTNPNDQVGSPSSPFRADGTQSNSDTNNFHDLVISDNYTVANNKINSFSVHFSDMVNAILAAPVKNFTYPVQGGGVATNPNLIFSDGSQTGQNVNVPQETLIRKYQFRDDFTWIKGKHNFKFGGNEIYFAKMGGFFFSGVGYAATFWDEPNCIQANACANGVYPNGISTPGALSILTFAGGSGSTAQPPWHSLGLYFQDDYKLKKNFTLNLGLRWDANIDFLQPQLGSGLTNSNRTIYWLRQTMLSSAFPSSDPGAQQIQQIVGNTGDLRRNTTDWKEFQPRLGFAWDVAGNGKDVIRGGYGIARDQIFQNITLWSIQQSQSTIYDTILTATTTVGPSGGPNNPGCASSGGPAGFNLCTFRFGIDPLPAPPAGSSDIAIGALGRITNPKITDPWSQQMSVGWSHAINPDYVFSADYYHILGTHEERVLNVNPQIGNVCDPKYGGNPNDPRCMGSTTTRLMDLAFADAGIGAGRFAQIYDYSTNNRSLYDGIDFQLRKRMTKRMMFQASYVLSWSRSWGGFPVASYGGSGLAVTPDQQFASNEYNRTNYDELNRLVISGVFHMPGGIELAPAFQAASGRPYSFIGGQDANGDGRHALDRVCVGSTLSDPVIPFVDSNQVPHNYGCSMIKPNTLTGKPFVQLNMRVQKTLSFGERSRLSVYAEFFDLFNRANFCNSYEENASAGPGVFNQPVAFCNGPSNSAYAGISGFSSAAVPSLHTQLGLRFEF
jgi:Carboxypeptidase regulatory-like domain/TonB dependent receptor